MFEWQRRKLEQKVKKAQADIAEALGHMQRPYVAWSTGKDSTVTLHLVLEQCPTAVAVYYDADCAFPETEEMLRTLPDLWDFKLLRYPCVPFLETVARHSHRSANDLGKALMKTTVYDPIRAVIAKNSFDGCFLGLRANEAAGRAKLLYSRKKLFFNQRDAVWQCLPVGWWSAEDVWNYIVDRDLPYNRVYDKTLFEARDEVRVSYWAGSSNKQQGRLVYLKYHYPELFNKLAAINPEVKMFV